MEGEKGRSHSVKLKIKWDNIILQAHPGRREPIRSERGKDYRG